MKTIAVVGMSPKPERPSHYVSVYMSQNGYNIIPVNPGHNSIMGKTSYSSLLDIKENDFIYADPPYDVPFHQYAQRGFTWDDQVRLAEWLSKHKGPVVLSNQATDRVIALYKKLGFKLKYLDAPRRISCKASGRNAVKEVIATRGI